MSDIAQPAGTPDQNRAGLRALIIVSIAAGLCYPLVDGRFGAFVDVAAKGLAVGPLAAAALFLPGPKWLAAIMTAGAIGDMLLEIPDGFYAGAGAFAIGHVVAMAFYARHRRPAPTQGDRLFAAGLIGFGLAMPGLVMPAGTPVGALMLYAVLLCGMAAATWISRFPRGLTAAGALLFVMSDTFLVMRMGGTLVGGALVHGLVVWYAYYMGQLMIFIGVRRG